jgi:putative endonuclease
MLYCSFRSVRSIGQILKLNTAKLKFLLPLHATVLHHPPLWFKIAAMRMLERLRIAGLERSLAGLQRLARRRGTLAKLPEHLATGLAGERAAYFCLRRKGYVVVARRWSAGIEPGDIDLIAWQNALLCFVEVKTRTARDATPAEVAVDSHKRAILRRLARNYLRQLPQETRPAVRFDVVSVYLVPGKDCEVEHFENAFGWSEDRESDWR